MTSPLILNGKKQSLIEIHAIAKKMATLSHLSRAPKLHVVLVGDNPSSHIYVRRKTEAAQICGFKSEVSILKKETSQEELETLLSELSLNRTVDAILLQLPLPSHLDHYSAIEKIDGHKDADALTPYQMGKLASGAPTQIIPCTAWGVWRLLRANHITTEGKKIAIIGRSAIVGTPLQLLLSRKDYGNATVTLLHSYSQSIKETCKNCDIVIAAMGQPEKVNDQWISEGSIVIDVGIHKTLENKIVGDVDYKKVKEKVEAISPVPGGVGPMTVAGLMHNTLQLYLQHMENEK